MNNARSGGSTASGGAFGAFGRGASAFGGGVFGQKSAFSALAGANTGNGASNKSSSVASKNAPHELTEDVLKRLLTDRPKWQLSSFGPASGEPNMISGTDISPEEARIEFLIAQRSGAVAAYEQKYAQLSNEMNQRIDGILSTLNVSARQWNEQKRAREQNSGAATDAGFGQGMPSAFGQQAKSAFAQGIQNSASGQSAFGKTGAFGQTPSAFSAFSQQPSSAFSQQPQTSSPFGQQASANSAFGQQQQTLPFGSTRSSGFQSGNTGGGFGISGSAFGLNATLVPAQISFGNSPDEVQASTGPWRDLTPDEASSFQAPEFTMGSVPEVPPPLELR
ncbi:Nucleoporin-like protein 2 [Dipsacomyces acuminosporus]|nr:Nucleoporin-like protein 2 [Dipsacomyces acuminosporus]